MRRRAFLVGCSGAVAAGVAGCTAFGGDGDYDVGMSSNAFLPDSLTVRPGETVVWENTGSRAHTVTAYDDGQPEGAEYFASGGYESEAVAREAWFDERGGAIDAGERFERAFEVPGTHAYVCIPHENGGMVGSIVVEE